MDDQWESQLRQPLTTDAQQQKQALQLECISMIRRKTQSYGSGVSPKNRQSSHATQQFKKDLTLQGIWTLKLPTRVSIFTRFLLQNKIITVDNLIKRGWNMPNIYYLCRSEEKDANHPFGYCRCTQHVRRLVVAHFANTIEFSDDLTQGRYKEVALLQGKMKQKRLQFTVCFVIWRERCSTIFRQEQKTSQALHMEIREEMRHWFRD